MLKSKSSSLHRLRSGITSHWLRAARKLHAWPAKQTRKTGTRLAACKSHIPRFSPAMQTNNRPNQPVCVGVRPSSHLFAKLAKLRAVNQSVKLGWWSSNKDGKPGLYWFG